MIADSLKEAREQGLKKYYTECKKHGVQAFAVLDNSCPVCVRENSARRRNNNYAYNRARERYNEIKIRAESKDIDFNIELDWLRYKLEEVSMCPYLGIPLNNTQSEAILNPDYNKSVDRINSNLGYTTDNIVICSVRANRIKNNATLNELRLLCENMERLNDARRSI